MTATVGVTLQRSTDTYLTTNVLDLFSLKNQIVLITGGARGIGLALAFAVAEAGGLVAIVDAAEQPHVHYEKLKDQCAKVKFYQSDVTNYETLKSTFDEVVADFGRIDGM